MAAQGAGTSRPGLYVDLSDDVLWHPLNYYFRRVRPWTRARTEAFSPLYAHLYTPREWQPALVSTARYEEFMRRLGSGGEAMPMVTFDSVVLLLPGPYVSCAL